MGSTSIGKKNWLFIGAAEAGKKGFSRKIFDSLAARFPQIVEDEERTCFLCHEYPKAATGVARILP